jgi:hypothetical protein
MNLCFRPARGTLFVCMSLALLGPQPVWAQADLTKLRVLAVIDTDSNLKKSVQKDQATIITTLCRGIPSGMFDLTVLAGEDATPDKIVDHYRKLRTNKSEALLFYFAGHGATDPQNGHFLAMEAGGLYRSELRDAMVATKAGLVVILTDCCSNVVPGPAKVNFPYYTTERLNPTYRALFFQHRGVVDITAASNDAAYCDDSRGGFFTWTLGNTVIQRRDRLDADGDGFVTWSEFFNVVQRDTQRMERRQRPHAFSLGELPGQD